MGFELTLLREIREAWRSLWRARALAAVAVLTTGLGIGASTTVFAVVDAILLRPMPFPDAHRLVRLWEGRPSRGEDRVGMSPANHADLTQSAKAFDGIALYWSTSAIVGVRQGSEQAATARVSRNLFRVLGVAPALGPGFDKDTVPYGSSQPEVIISHRFWQRHYGGDPHVIGQVLLFEHRFPNRIAGIMPRGFDFPRGTEVWQADEAGLNVVRNEKFRDAIGRLRPGVGLDAATRELQAIGQRLAIAYPAENHEWAMTLAPLGEATVAAVRPLLLLLAIAVACVTALAWSNVLGLLVGRAASRAVEIAVRRALGGSTLQVLRAWIVEGLLLAIAGGALGFLLASWLLPALVALAPSGIPRIEEVAIGPRTAAFALALSLIGAVLFALAPLGVLRTRNLGTPLIHSGRSAVGQARHRVRRTLIVVQTMVTITLVFAAGLLVQAFAALQRTDLGFNPDRVVVARLAVPIARFLPAGTMRPEWARVLQLYEDATAVVAAMPGVRTAALGGEVPLTGSDGPYHVRFPGTPDAATQRIAVTRQLVSPAFFDAMGIRLVSGRTFDARDRLEPGELDGTKPRRPTGVAIVNRVFADRFLAGRTPERQTVAFVEGGDRVRAREIVGVVENVRDAGLDVPSTPAIYVPFAQSPRFKQMLVVKTSGDPAAFAAALRPVVRRIDRDLMVSEETTMRHVVAEAGARPRFLTLTVAGFAVMGVLLALIGTYGFIAYLTSLREQEMGVRLAVGASPWQIAWLVMADGLRLAAIGIVFGAFASFAAARAVAAAVPSAGASVDAGTVGMFAASLGVILLTVLAGTYVPSRRAMRVDPAVVLRRS